MYKSKYNYEGTVMEFDRVIATRWQASTWAVSPEKAKTNLAYQFKRMTGRIPSCKISLPGTLNKVV
ncbi:MAG: hypothetical protein LBU67_03210 [Oscillospiraceae bacterium]|nr:hypothetical protein [Oscillospiraceae bacterium]